MSWSDNKKLSLGVDIISWNSTKKKKKDVSLPSITNQEKPNS